MNENARITPPSARTRPSLARCASILAAFGAAVAVGCGGGLAEPAMPNESVGSAEQEVDAAEARLSAALGAKSAPASGGDTGTQQIPTPHPQPTTQPEPPTPDATPLDSEEDRCRVACDALTSMIRAVDRLCMITGQSDERCQSRRARADSASARVVQSCPSCNV